MLLNYVFDNVIINTSYSKNNKYSNKNYTKYNKLTIN